MTTSFTIAILAGGLSTRMGVDKATLTMDGRSLLTHLALTAQATGHTVVVVGRDRPEDWGVDGVEFIPDATPGLGPIGGLLAALRYVDEPVLAMACDMPRMTAGAVEWLASEAEARKPVYGLAVRNGEQLEPLFSVYMPSLIPVVEARIDSGRRSLHGLFDAAAVDVVDAPEEVRRALVNVNTVEEWEKLGNRE